MKDKRLLDPKDLNVCETCGKYVLGDICNECEDNKEFEREE